MQAVPECRVMQAVPEFQSSGVVDAQNVEQDAQKKKSARQSTYTISRETYNLKVLGVKLTQKLLQFASVLLKNATVVPKLR